MTGTHTDTIAGSTRLPIAVRDFGGSGLPIVLIHGLGRSLADWIHFAPLLTARHRVIAMDVRGHGASGDGPWSWEAATDDVADVVEHLGLSAPAVAGHSLGGLIAAVWAERHPECPGAISLDGAPWPGPDECVGMDLDTFQKLRAEAEAQFERGMAAAAGPLSDVQLAGIRAQQQAFGISESDLEEVIGRMLESRDGQTYLRTSMEWGRPVFRSFQELDLFSVYRRVSCPLLIVNALEVVPGAGTGREQSGLAQMFAAARKALTRDLTALADELPNVRLENVEATHGLIFEHPQVIADLITGFLSTPADRAGSPTVRRSE